MITGFCGRVFYARRTPSSAPPCTRAWNDWIHDEWYAPYPDRFIPLGITYLADPQLAADEIRRNAARGFTSVSMPERPHKLGLPSLWDRDHWDPIIQACDETDTVISIHVASSGGYESAARRARPRSSAPRCSGSCRSRPRPSGCGRSTR